MKFGVVVFPGSNCDEDMVHALQHNCGQQVVKLWHKDTSLQGADVVVLPGGFSYGDYLRSGAIARFSPIMQAVVAHAQQGGYLLGICNGFQILCEAGLLPGALLHNDSRRFVCRNVFIRPQHSSSPFTHGLDTTRAYCIPIAHGEGKYYAKPEVLAELEANQQILFRYCTENGEETAEANPNGSLHHIAGVCNRQGNVMGMMPHPERAADAQLHNTDGLPLLMALVNHLSQVAA